MKKNSTKGYAVLGILFVLVSVVAFVIPVPKNAAFWVSYGFTVIAFAAQIMIWKTAFGRGEALKSKFIGFPMIHIGIVYLVAQILVLAIFLCFPALPPWSSVVACTVIAGIAAVCVIVSDVSRGEIERVSEKVQKKVFYIKQLQVDIEILADAENDAATKIELQQLAEKVQYSDPMSSGQLADLEKRIAARIAELQSDTDKTAIINELNLLLDERNRKCKIIKALLK